MNWGNGYCSLSGMIPSGIIDILLLFQTSGRWNFIFNILYMSVFTFGEKKLGGARAPRPLPLLRHCFHGTWFSNDLLLHHYLFPQHLQFLGNLMNSISSLLLTYFSSLDRQLAAGHIFGAWFTFLLENIAFPGFFLCLKFQSSSIILQIRIRFCCLISTSVNSVLLIA